MPVMGWQHTSDSCMQRQAGRAGLIGARVVVLLRSVGSAAFLFTARAGAVIYQLRYATHAFGSQYAGLIALLNQLTFYILLAELGLAAATTSLLFEPVHSGDAPRVKALIAVLQKKVHSICLWLGPAVFCVALLLSLWLRKQVPFAALCPSLLLTGVSALLTFAALPYQSHLNATDRVPLRNMLLGCGFALKVGLGVVLASWSHAFVGLPLGAALVSSLEYLLQRRLVLPRLGPAEVPIPLLDEAWNSIRSRAKFVLAHRIGYLFGYQSDYIILLLSSSISLLGFYAQYQYIYAGLLSLALTVGGTFTAKIARQQLKVGRDAFSSLYRSTSLLAAAGALVCGSGFYLLAEPAVRVLYHSGGPDASAIPLFAILLMLNIVKMNDDIWIDTTGAYDKGYYLPILEAATYVVLGLSLVHGHGVAGILYAGIATNILFSIFFKALVLGRGVMSQQMASTMTSKALGLLGMAGGFAAMMFVVRLLRDV